MSVQQMVCSPVQFPTFDDFYLQLKGLKLNFNPSLPSLPSPLFPNMTIPDINTINLSTQMVLNQFLNWIKAVIDPMMAFVGAIPFPTIPELNLTLPDLLSMNFNMPDLVARFKLNLPNIHVPSLPDPLFPGMSIPDFEVVAKIQALITNYCTALVTMVTGLIDSVIAKLGKKPFNFSVSFPSLPTLPTDFNALIAPILAALNVPDIDALLAKIKLNGISLPELFMNIKFPGFPDMNLAIPSPLFGDIHSPSLELAEIAKNYYLAMVNYCAKKIGEFCDKITAFVNFNLPTVCVPVMVA